MRLINTRTHELHEFLTPSEIKYAILSHRWEKEEVSYAQLTASDLSRSKAKRTKGWEKIKNFCYTALSMAIEWAWVDTCCIDKSSSAELSEAINSMYSWYANAVICIVYMSDVVEARVDTHPFEKSKWFTRGWTLQELLAPTKLIYYDSNWEYLGTRKDLCREVSEITNIPLPILYDPSRYRIEYTCVAQRMSWVSKRHTTRSEDIAYCLLGIFNCSMPLLYGEGAEKAFQRLQLEILGKSDDESIFAWTKHANQIKTMPMLAPLPSLFSNSGDVRSAVPYDSSGSRPPAMTNWGLSMHKPLCPQKSLIQDKILLLEFQLPTSHDWPWVSSRMYMPIACTLYGRPLAVVLALAEAKDSYHVYERECLATLREKIEKGLLTWYDIFVRCQGQLEAKRSPVDPDAFGNSAAAQLIIDDILGKSINEQRSTLIFKALDFLVSGKPGDEGCTIASAPGAEPEELLEGIRKLAFVDERVERKIKMMRHITQEARKMTLDSLRQLDVEIGSSKSTVANAPNACQ